MTEEDIIKYVQCVLQSTAKSLDEETVQGVEHYLAHDEPEMAFEGLFLELIRQDIPVNIDSEFAKAVARKLKLDQESVFDTNFWPQFVNYVKQS